MSNTDCAAPQCQKPAHNGYLCSSCYHTLHHDLSAIPDLLVDLEITISKQDRLVDVEKRPTDERPLPLRLGPMEAKRDLVQTLRTWASTLLPGYLPRTPIDTTMELLRHIDDIQLDHRAGDVADEVGYAVITAQRAVDKPLQLVYVGPCDDCAADLYAHPRRSKVACRNCDAVYDIAARREWLLEQAEGQLLTATEMSRALPGLLGRPLTASMIRGYAYRGRLTQYPPHPERPTEPRYKVGEVLDLLTEIREKTSRAQAC